MRNTTAMMIGGWKPCAAAAAMDALIGEAIAPFEVVHHRSVVGFPALPVMPYTREMPKRMIAELTAPMTKNFAAASVARASFFRNATRAKVHSVLSSKART